MNKLTVYVSSAQGEFEYERSAIADMMTSDPLLQEHFKAILFEALVPAGARADDVSQQAVRSSDVFLLLVGQQYGSVGDDGLSHTQREYQLARALGKPCLVFIRGTQRLSRDTQASAFVHQIEKDGLLYRRFGDLASLRQMVSAALVEVLASFNIDTALSSKVDLLEASSGSSAAVFIVHGRDEKVLYQVARFLERLVPKVTILSEQPSKGKTIIEKFEHYSNDVGFAVALLTGDDRGGLHGVPARKQVPRARQNVIFELGYFIGKIGRDRVAALYAPGVELPSDYAGVVYIFLDENGGWKNKLATEIKSAGLAIDPNALLG